MFVTLYTNTSIESLKMYFFDKSYIYYMFTGLTHVYTQTHVHPFDER